MGDKKSKKKQATPATTAEIFIKDQVLTMSDNKVVNRRPRKQNEGTDNSTQYFKNLRKKK